MKKATQKKRSTLVKGSVETQSYIAWIADLKRRYRATQIKAAVAVNSALIDFYWNLGKDITEKFAEGAGYGSRFFENVSFDMRTEFPNDTGFSPRNIRYCQDFYRLYSAAPILPQVVAKSAKGKHADSKMPQLAAKCSHSQLVEDKIMQQLVAQLISVPWGHHRTIIDKCKRDRDKALFYVRRTIQNGWSRNSLLNWLSTDLYEREGKAQTNFDLTMPSDDCDLARQLVKDPQKFEVFGLSRVLAKYHLEELGLPMGITDYELKKVLPTKAQLTKCVADAERQIARASMARHTNPSNSGTGR